MKFLILGSLFLFSAHSATLDCNSLVNCIEKISEITKKNHYLLEDIKDTKFKPIKFEGDSQKIDNLFSLTLYRHGFTRIPFEDGLIIYSTRDVRYEPTELLSVDEFKSIPKNYDYKLVNYKLKNKLVSKQIIRSLRPFMSRYGRVINSEHSGFLTLQDTGVNIERMLKLIDIYDVPYSDEEKKRFEDDSKHHRKLELIRAKNSSVKKHD